MKNSLLKNLLKIIVPSAILVFLFYSVIKSWSLLKENLIAGNPFILISALAVLVITFLGGALFWQKILSNFGINIKFLEALRIFTISNFGRFVPGIVVHYLARIYMSKKIGIGVKKSAMTVVLEAYYTLTGAVIIGGLGISSFAKLINLPKEILLTIYFILVIIIFVIPPMKIIGYVSRIPFFDKKIKFSSVHFNYKRHFFLCIFSAGLFLLNGIAFYFLSLNFFGLDFRYFWEVSGLFALSWITGFLTPVAPGGLGVSDLSFVFLLSPLYTLPQASFLVVLYRIGLLLAEGLVFLAVMSFSKAEILGNKKNEKS